MDRKKVKKKLNIWYSIVWLFLFIGFYVGYFNYFIEINSTKSKWIGLVAGALAILLGSYKYCEISLYHSNDLNIKKHVKELRKRFLKFNLENTVFLIPFVIIFGLIINYFKNTESAICFFVGIFGICISNLIESNILSEAKIKAEKEFENSLDVSRKLSLSTTSAITLFYTGIALVLFVILFHAFKDYEALYSFCFGYALIGSVKILSNIISRKTIENADNVIKEICTSGNNPNYFLNIFNKTFLRVSNIENSSIIIFLSCLVSSMCIGANSLNLMGSFLPVVICSNGIFSSIIVALFNKISKSRNIIRNYFKLIISTQFLTCLVSFFTIKTWLPDMTNLTYPIILGAVSSIIICFINIKYVKEHYNPIRKIANSATCGLVQTSLQTISESCSSVFFPVLIIGACLAGSFVLVGGLKAPMAGLYGISLFGISLIAITIPFISLNSFAKFKINYFEHEENFNYLEKNSLEKLLYYIDVIGKNYSILTMIVSTIVVAIAFSITVNVSEIDLLNPYVICSVFIGVGIIFLHCKNSIRAISSTTSKLILENKNQIRLYESDENYNIDYSKVSKLLNKNTSVKALKNLILIGIILILVKIFLYDEGLCGLIYGCLIASMGMIFGLSNSYNLSIGAKQYYEKQITNLDKTEELNVIENNYKFYSILRETIDFNIATLISLIVIGVLTFSNLVI